MMLRLSRIFALCFVVWSLLVWNTPCHAQDQDFWLYGSGVLDVPVGQYDTLTVGITCSSALTGVTARIWVEDSSSVFRMIDSVVTLIWRPDHSTHAKARIEFAPTSHREYVSVIKASSSNYLGTFNSQNMVGGSAIPAIPGIYMESLPIQPMSLSWPGVADMDNHRSFSISNREFSDGDLIYGVDFPDRPFRVECKSDRQLPVGESTTFTVFLDSARSGSYSDSVVISSNSANSRARIVVPLVGNVKQRSKLSVSQTVRWFISPPSSPEDTTKIIEFKASASGESFQVWLDSLPPPFYFEESTPRMFELPKGTKRSIRVRFAPTQQGTYSARLTGRSNSHGFNSFLIPLNGSQSSLSVDDGNTARIRVWPNPCTDHLWIEGMRAVSPVTVYNQLGQIQEVSADDDGRGLKLYISHLPMGTFFFSYGESNLRFLKH